jgi:hypothetical protein
LRHLGPHYLGPTFSLDPAAQSRQDNSAKLQLEGLEAAREPGRRALLYADGAQGLLGNISVPSGATHVIFYGLVPGARYRVDITSSQGAITQSVTGHTSECQKFCALGLGLEDLALGRQVRVGEKLRRARQGSSRAIDTYGP